MSGMPVKVESMSGSHVVNLYYVTENIFIII